MKPRKQHRAPTSTKRSSNLCRSQSRIPPENLDKQTHKSSHTLPGPVKAASPAALMAQTAQSLPSGAPSAPSTIFNQPGTALVWAEPFNRNYPRVISGDIKRAIEWFKQVTGREVETITLHPTLAKLAAEAPQGVKVRFIGGCLAFEIWLTPGQTIKPFVEPVTEKQVTDVALSTTPAPPAPRQPRKAPPAVFGGIHTPHLATKSKERPTKKNKKHPVNGKSQLQAPGTKGGTKVNNPWRPKIELPVELVKELAGKGFGSRPIAEHLNKNGYQVSYKTVQRLLPSIIQPELSKRR